MSKRRYSFEEEDEVEEIVPEVIIKKTKVRSLIEAKLSYTGKVSGRPYEWVKAGAVVSVADEDVPELLGKRLGRKSCCGDNENKIFELA